MQKGKHPQSSRLAHLSAAWRVSPQGAAEFAIVVGTFILCDPTVASLIVGGAISLCGELLRLITAGYGYKIGELTLRGPYRFVRHPYYLGNALLFFGLCVAARNPYVMAGALVAMTLCFALGARRDEERWLRYLGPRFDDYRARVPACLPQLWPVSAKQDDKRLFSLKYAIFTGRHREFDALLGLGLAYGLFYLCYRLVVKDLFQLGVIIMVGLYLTGRFIYYGFAHRSKRPTPRTA